MGADMGMIERVQLAEGSVDRAFFDATRAAAREGYQFAGEVTDIAGVRVMRPTVEDRLTKVVGPDALVTCALQGAFLSTFVEYYLKNNHTKPKMRRRMIAYGVRAQRYLAKTFCALSPLGVAQFRQAAAVGHLGSKAVVGPCTMATVIRRLARHDDLVIYFPKAADDLFGVDLVVLHRTNPCGAYLQVKTGAREGGTHVITDEHTAHRVGGARLVADFRSWRGRGYQSAVDHPGVTWLPFYVLVGDYTLSDATRLDVIAQQLRAPTPTTPS